MASTLNPSIRRVRTAIAAAAVVAGLAVAGSAPARAAASTTAPAPRACVPGKIVGGFVDPDGKVRGLLRDDKGSFTAFFAPQAVSQTGALDINARRQIVGIFR